MNADRNAAAWQRWWVRFYVSTVVSGIEILLDLSLIVRPNHPLSHYFISLGAETLVTVSLFTWIFWFHCPRCGRNFFLAPKRLGIKSCAHCGLLLGALRNPDSG